MTHLLAPSILAADFTQLGNEIERVNRSEADWIHCDVMDGRFVPNISFGIPVITAVKKIARKPLDVHLMIVEPEKYLRAFHKAGADRITVHQEAVMHLDRTLHAIREMGLKSGVALNPATPVETLKHILPLADLVLLMTVNPGFGGQSFIPYVYDKIFQLKTLIRETGNPTLIQVDGGVDKHNVAQLVRAGVDVLVAGSSVFGTNDPEAAIRELKKPISYSI
ncbi:MAG: ribulose-phosphate 3-epimerase [Bacteroidia bacterium]|nr:ribulose-phosphate 3-epimerase [Bacteroidia bacterium]